MTAQAQPPAKATRREWLALIILVLPTLLVSMDMTVTYLALPAISAALKPTSAQLLWITDMYGFIDASLLIIMGTLGDRWGLRKLLLTGGFGFAAASTLAAFSTSPVLLIISRGVLGVAGATLLTSTISIIRNIFHDDAQRTFALGLYTTCFSSGTMLGPLTGGFLLSHFWWGAVFLIAIPLMVLLLSTAPLLLPEFKDKTAGRLDLRSALLLVTAILAAIYGIKQLAQDGFAVFPASCVATGAAIGIIFFHRQQVTLHPLIDINLFKKTTFNTALLALFTGLFAWGGIFLFVGQYLQLVTGLDSFTAGLYTMPSAAGSIVLCMLAPAALRYMRRGFLITAGLIILAVGITLLTLVTVNSLGLLVVATVLMSGGCGVTVTLGIDMVVASAPPNKAGAAAGISETSTGFGGALGVAILGSIWTVLYRARISPAIPAGLPAADAENMRNTLAGAISAAYRFNSTIQQPVILAARNAFVHSFNITCGICAALVFITAFITALKLRQA